MITYALCSEAGMDAAYGAFQIGFSDYIIKTELTREQFVRRFFGPEGNRPEHSVVALDGETPVGLILGGLKVYEGIQTLRCGALCVHPAYRGTGVSRELFRRHKEIALENSCRQLFLEVIAGNDRAVNFYNRMGYEKVYDLAYFSHSAPAEIPVNLPDGFAIRHIGEDGLRTLFRKAQGVHINWQNDFDYIVQSGANTHFGVFRGEMLAGGLSAHPRGRVSFLWVEPDCRLVGLGKALLGHAARELAIAKLQISFPSNASLLGFVKRLGFQRDPLSQYEMYLTL